MKKFILGLIVGLIVGPLATLLILQNVQEPEKASDSEESYSGQAPKRRAPKGLEGASLRLRSWLEGKPKEDLYAAHIDFLEHAIFDREWPSVSVVASSLRDFNRGAGEVKKTEPSSPVTAPKERPPSMALLQHEYKALQFWREFFKHENEALTVYRSPKKDGRLSRLKKLLKTTAQTAEDQRNKKDAAFLLGRYGGDDGLRTLSAFILSSRSLDDWRLGTQALGRSQNSGALAVLQELCDGSRESKLQALALEAMVHLRDVTKAESEATLFLGRLLSDPRRILQVRLKGIALLETMDLDEADAFQKTLVKVLSNTNEDPKAREALTHALGQNAQTNLALPDRIVRCLERIAKEEQDSETRCEAFKALEFAGTRETLKVLLDSEATVADARCLAALRQCREVLTRRFGEL